jgi:hypothetical protein
MPFRTPASDPDRKLAEDFKRYLTFRPGAHLIHSGHADPRGSVAYNKGLTDRRVDVTLSTTGQKSTRRYPFNAKDFLALNNTKGGETDRQPTPAHRKKANP